MLVVGELHEAILRVNEEAFVMLRWEKSLQIIPRATNLFEEHGALEDVAQRAAERFERHLGALRGTETDHERPFPRSRGSRSAAGG